MAADETLILKFIYDSPRVLQIPPNFAGFDERLVYDSGNHLSLADNSAATARLAAHMTKLILYEVSERQYQLSPHTLRPPRNGLADTLSAAWQPYMVLSSLDHSLWVTRCREAGFGESSGKLVAAGCESVKRALNVSKFKV